MCGGKKSENKIEVRQALRERSRARRGYTEGSEALTKQESCWRKQYYCSPKREWDAPEERRGREQHSRTRENWLQRRSRKEQHHWMGSMRSHVV